MPHTLPVVTWTAWECGGGGGKEPCIFFFICTFICYLNISKDGICCFSDSNKNDIGERQKK